MSDLFEELQILDEMSSINRVFHHFHNGFFIVSAFRSHLPYERNVERTKELQNYVRENHLGYIPLLGIYGEKGQSASAEFSILVPYRKDIMPMKKFEKFAYSCANSEYFIKEEDRKEKQESLIIVDNSEELKLVSNEGDVWATFDFDMVDDEFYSDILAILPVRKKSQLDVLRDKIDERSRESGKAQVGTALQKGNRNARNRMWRFPEK